MNRPPWSRRRFLILFLLHKINKRLQLYILFRTFTLITKFSLLLITVSVLAGLIEVNMSEKAPHNLRAAPIKSSPRRPSSINAATVFTPLVISGKLLEIVEIAAPTAV